MENLNIMQLITPFGEKIKNDAPLPEYPRPQLVRDSYLNLNGEWDYAIYNDSMPFAGYQGKIIVPFSPESTLSGVGKILQPNEVLYYKRTFKLPKNFKKDKILLHFGAVDYSCEVFVNGKLVGKHKGGFFPFNFDITDQLVDGVNELSLSVTDPSDTQDQGKGKQRLKRGGIFYTPQSGIWQTVWLESTVENFIEKTRLTPDIDKSILKIELFSAKPFEKVDIEVSFNGKLINHTTGAGNYFECAVKNAQLWSPESPALYDLKIKADHDKITSYFGMRKISAEKDEKGYMRIFLNNKPYFHNGLLDQGYWPDGLYTPPSEEAIIYDIEMTKKMGFNMLRKHIKIEPLRWYYHCDKLGIIVWQDFINGGYHANNLVLSALSFVKVKIKDNKYKWFGRKNKESRDDFYIESIKTMDALYNSPAIAVWVPFNEAWGQFDALKSVEFIKEHDKTRLIDHASGWHDQGGGDFLSHHIYFRKVKYVPKESEKNRIYVLSEFGGYSLKIDDHVFNLTKAFGYKKYSTPEDFEKAYVDLFETQIIPLIDKGLSATVYTQISDVEDEINGLLTYDRKVLKIPLETLKKLNEKLKFN